MLGEMRLCYLRLVEVGCVGVCCLRLVEVVLVVLSEVAQSDQLVVKRDSCANFSQNALWPSLM